MWWGVGVVLVCGSKVQVVVCGEEERYPGMRYGSEDQGRGWGVVTMCGRGTGVVVGGREVGVAVCGRERYRGTW